MQTIVTRFVWFAIFACTGFLAMYEVADAADSTVPEPFRSYDNSAQYTISYYDLTAVLKAAVVDAGRSTREVAAPTHAKTGTRMKAEVKRLTVNECNRFYFETFRDNGASQEFLRGLQESLEELPSQAPLEYFSRDEQLAYWLNLYNVTMLNQIITVYPKRDLKKLFRGKNSILDKKLLTVAGVPLSLNDIQFTILRQNYDGDPLVMYGLYQGIVGGPDIRKTAYTGANVYAALADNARDFSDLPAHPMSYLEGHKRIELQSASRISADIDDWSVTDLGGTQQQIGGSLADSRAALMDSVQSTVLSDPKNPLTSGTLGASVGAGSSSMASKGRRLSRIDPEVRIMLRANNESRMRENDSRLSRCAGFLNRIVLDLLCFSAA